MHRAVQTRVVTKSTLLPDVLGLGGALSGLLAGLVMIVLSPALSLLSQINVWQPPKLIAATFFGPSALAGPAFAFGPVVAGTAIHLAVSMALGIVFGLVFHRVFHLTTSFGTPLLLGLCYGLFIFLLAFAVVLPILSPTMSALYQAPMLAQNMVFGVCLGGFYTVLRPNPYRQ